MRVCAKCGSRNIVWDKEDIGPGWHDYEKCLMCGTRKFKEVDVSEKPRCKSNDCDKVAATYGYCNAHFYELYGITAGEYNRNKGRWHEDPREVAARIKAQGGTKQAKPALPQPSGVKVTKQPKAETKAPADETKAHEPETKANDTRYVMVKTYAVMLPADLYERIEQLAKDEFRPVDMQVQYLIHKGLRT